MQHHLLTSVSGNNQIFDFADGSDGPGGLEVLAVLWF